MYNFTHYPQSVTQDVFSPVELISSITYTGSHTHGTKDYNSLIPDILWIAPVDNWVAGAIPHMGAYVSPKSGLILRHSQ